VTDAAPRPLYDVIVVGAGPVGSYAALRLAQSGLRVAVLERQPHPNDAVCCTGIVSAACYRRFIEFTGVRALPARSAFVIGPSGRLLYIQKPQTQAYIVDRPALNARLAQMAAAAGAACFFGCTVRQVSQPTGLCQVQTTPSPSTFYSRAVILACGLASSLPRSLGFASIPETAAAAQVPVATSVEEVEVYLDPDLAPGGLAWLVPSWDGRGLAGLVTRGRSRSRLSSSKAEGRIGDSPRGASKRLAAFVSTLRAAGKITDTIGEVSGKFVPMAVRPGRTAIGNIIVLGEAAGQVKPTTVGGLHSGFLCADLAVETLNLSFRRFRPENQRSHRLLSSFRRFRPEKSGEAGHPAHPAESSPVIPLSLDGSPSQHSLSLASYDRLWRSQLGPELRLGHALRRYYDSLSDKQLGRLFEAVAEHRLHQRALGWKDFSFDWHGGPLRRLLIQSGVLRTILTPKLLPLIAAIMRRSTPPIDTP